MIDILYSHHKDLLFQTLNNAAIENEELNLIAILKPSLTIDGDNYCYLHGENLQEGVSGFGKSPYLAALDFRKNYYKEQK